MSLSPASQEWSNALESRKNTSVDQFVRNGMLEDSPDTTHPRVDCATSPTEFHHLDPDGLERQRPEVFRREHAVKLIQGLDHRANDMNFAGLLAVLELMRFGMSQ